MSTPGIIVVGASAGGVEALTRLVADLPSNLPAAVFVVLHLAPHSQSHLASILKRASQLEVTSAWDGDIIRPGWIYVAIPDHHLTLEDGLVRIGHGPKENRHRPAIDALFRSAAFSHGSRVIGVILTGALDDGTAGLLAIKQCGGIAIVQDPNDAFCPEMPRNALAHVNADAVVPVVEMGALLTRLVRVPVESAHEDASTRELLWKEIQLTDLRHTSPASDDGPGVPSAYPCPEWHGTLSEIHDGSLIRYTCRVGHGFSRDALMKGQDDALETALRSALKTLEESTSLTQHSLAQAKAGGMDWLVKRFSQKLIELDVTFDETEDRRSGKLCAVNVRPAR
mgnify:CR=1 FL=1